MGTLVTGTLSPFASKAYQFTNPTAGAILVTLSGEGEGVAAVAIDERGSSSEGVLTATVDASSLLLAAGQVFYVVVFDVAGDAGQFTLDVVNLNLTTEAEPNDAEPEAQVLPSIPIVMRGSLSE